MSTGADCTIYEEPRRAWHYRIQRYPYGETREYDQHGPFPTFQAAHADLSRRYANPGGYARLALPGCPHDLVHPEDDDWCQRCGGHIRCNWCRGERVYQGQKCRHCNGTGKEYAV
jgi:hypothetical protein